MPLSGRIYADTLRGGRRTTTFNRKVRRLHIEVTEDVAAYFKDAYGHSLSRMIFLYVYNNSHLDHNLEGACGSMIAGIHRARMCLKACVCVFACVCF